MIRLARPGDIDAVAAIYEAIHAEEEAGRAVIGWGRGVYPTRATAEAALAAGELYVLERDGRVAASARINRAQLPEYASAAWRFPAPDDRVLVMHTLCVDPACARSGCGRSFVAFYQDLARAEGCTALRIDTNARNARARAMYSSLGFREAGIVPCTFNGLPGVELVLLEKPV